MNETIFLALLAEEGIPIPVSEYKFHPVRKWRMDFCWVDYGVFLEVQGGLFVQGRHSRGAAMLKEFEKTNAASEMGYRMLLCQPKDLCSTTTIETIRKTLAYIPTP